MIGSAKFKKLSLLLINVLVLLISCPILSFADVVDPPVEVVSKRSVPVPVYQVTGNQVHIELYAVRQWRSQGVLYTNIYEIVVDGPIGNYAYYANGANDHCILANVDFGSMTNYRYDIDGNFLEQQSRSGSAASVQGYSYRAYLWNGNWPQIGYVYLFLPQEVELKGSSYLYQSDFVTWASVAPDAAHYRSYMAEPVADEYNQYLIVGNGVGAYLIWISIEQIEFQSTGVASDRISFYDGQFWSNTVILQNNGATYNMVYQVPNALDQLSYAAYAIMISQFDLNTGQYISSSLYADQAVSQTISINISDFVFDMDEITDVCVYGCNLIINDLTMNRIAVEWSVSPSWETWKSNVILYLEEIYSVLSQDGEEVTIEQDTSGMDEARSAVDDLKVTDQNGSEVNAAEKASEAFSQADAGIQDMAEPVSWINGQITDNVFFLPKLLIPIVVALSLGLLITILGKNKSDV